MKKILLLCLFLFSIALSYGGSLTPEPAENVTIENVLSLDIDAAIIMASPVISYDIFIKQNSLACYNYERDIFYNELRKKTTRKRHAKTIYREGLLLFSISELKNSNSNGYSLILNNTSGGLSEIRS